VSSAIAKALSSYNADSVPCRDNSCLYINSKSVILLFLLILDPGTYENRIAGVKKRHKPKWYLFYIAGHM